ncbi:MAG: TM1812 family CRISPR-associated protein [Euryarchaeota archaeon]
MKLHVLITIGSVSGYEKPGEREGKVEPWLIQASLLRRLGAEPSDTEVWTVENREVEVVEGSARELGTVALLEVLHEEADVEPGKAVVVSTEIIGRGGEREEYEKKVRGPLEELGYGVEERTGARLSEPGTLVNQVCAEALELLREGDRVLFDLTHGARVMPFASALGLVPALQALVFRHGSAGGGKLWERVAFAYGISGHEVKGVVEGGRWLVADVTDAVLAWLARDATARYLADPSPRWVDVIEGALDAMGRGAGGWVDELREFARVERASSPGPVHVFAREGSVSGDALVEFVWGELREAFLGSERVPERPVREVVEPGGPLSGEEREEVVRRLRLVGEFLRRYCSYMLDRGRVAEVASLMNETHLLLRVLAKLVEPFVSEGAYKRARASGRSEEELKGLKKLAAATLDELYSKFFDPFEGLREARAAEREILEELEVDVAGSGEGPVWVGWSESGEILKSLVGGGLPFKRELGRRFRDVVEDELLRRFSGTDDPAKLVLDDPPIRRIRNKLQHGDPVDYDGEVHRGLVEVCRRHLEELTLPLIDALVEILRRG